MFIINLSKLISKLSNSEKLYYLIILRYLKVVSLKNKFKPRYLCSLIFNERMRKATRGQYFYLSLNVDFIRLATFYRKIKN